MDVDIMFDHVLSYVLPWVLSMVAW